MVLRKTEYSESSLISAVLTVDAGQHHFLFKGVRKSTRNKFPAVDLFRRLRIIYQPSTKSDLSTVRETELIQSHDAIALKADNFATAVWLSKFILKNTQFNISVPDVFQALNIAFSRLSSDLCVSHRPIVIGIYFIVLADNGLLPEYPDDPTLQSGFDQMIRFALNIQSPVPDFSPSTWEKLENWTRKFIVHHTPLVLPRPKS